MKSGLIGVLYAATVLAGSTAAGDEAAAHAADAAGRPRLIVEVEDGSRVNGAAADRIVLMDLPMGKLELPIEHIAAIRFDREAQVAHVELLNGDRLHGTWVEPEALRLVTRHLGTLSLPAQRILSVRRIGAGSGQATTTAIPGAEFVDALLPLGDDGDTVLAVTQNVGAQCGGGTPATVWRLTFEPAADPPVRQEKIQALDQIQQVRSALFRSSDGTLFTGGGWCGAKPPYYSADGGKSWKPATEGTYPPNSTFSYAELKGKVFAGTGYEPHHGQVYRWLGNGAWEVVLDVEPPRSILTPMTVFRDRLFVSAQIYWQGVREGGVPVYVSDDGKTFRPTAGIPATDNVTQMLASRGRFFAFAGSGENRILYEWDDEQWVPRGDWPAFEAAPVASERGVWFGCGKGDGSLAVYRSDNQGREWKRLRAVEAPSVRCMAVRNDRLYIGATGDGTPQGNAKVLRLEVEP